jgi:hypothetical protein
MANRKFADDKWVCGYSPIVKEARQASILAAEMIDPD